MATEQRTIEKWKNGVLVSSEVIDVEVDDVTETVEIPKDAVAKLATDMADSSVNSIAEVKKAVLDFVQSINQ